MNHVAFFLLVLAGCTCFGGSLSCACSNEKDAALMLCVQKSVVARQRQNSPLFADQQQLTFRHDEQEYPDASVDAGSSSQLIQQQNSRYVVKPVSFNSSGMDFSPVPYKDGIVFVSSRHSKNSAQQAHEDFLNLFYTQEGEDGAFSEPQLLNKDNNTPYHLGPTVFFNNEKQKIVTRNSFIRSGKIKDGSAVTLELAQSSLSASGKWSALLPMQFRSSEYSIGHPAISSDGSTLYFSSNMPGSVGGSDLFVSYYENGAWSTPKSLGPKINTAGQELFPYLHNDSILYFSSTGHNSLGGLDIFYCNPKAPDQTPIRLDEPMNSQKDDFGICLDMKGVSGFFSSNRSGEGADDIYYFEEITQFAEIQLYDSLTGAYIRDAQLNLLIDKKRAAQATSDLMGRTEFRLSASRSYSLSVSHELYKTASIQLVPSTWRVNQQARIKIYLSPVVHDAVLKGSTASLQIRDRKNVTNTISFSSAPLDIDLISETTGKSVAGEVDSLSTDQLKVVAVENVNGLPSVMICRKDTIYDFHAASATLLRNSALQFQLSIPLGAMRNDYEKVITEQITRYGYGVSRFLLIRSFHFDSEKTLIRNDASAQLDKIIEVMTSYPQIDVQLIFHSDSRGTDKFNLELSRRRSEEVMNYLTRAGIKKTRILSHFVGESQLLNDCGDLSDCDELQHQRNRTTEFKLIVREENSKE
jgi:outer membrane protein OmpA-like peptidoglycan-associated protein